MIGYNEFGIDLRKSSIVISVVSKDNILEAYEVYKTSSVRYSDEYFEELKLSLKDFSKNNSYKMQSFNISLEVDNENVFLHSIESPYINRKSFRKSVNFEISQKLEEEKIRASVYSTWRQVSKAEDGDETTTVLIASIKKGLADKLSQFKTVTSKIGRVFVKPVLYEDIDEEGTFALIDISEDSSSISVYDKGRLLQNEVVKVNNEAIYRKLNDFIEHKELDESLESLIKLIDESIKEESGEEITNESWITEDIYGDILNEDKSNELYISEEGRINEEARSYIEEEVLSVVEEMKRVIRMIELENNVQLNKVYLKGFLSNFKFIRENIEKEMGVKAYSFKEEFLEKAEDGIIDSYYSSKNYKKKDPTDFSKTVKANIDYSSVVILMIALSLSTGIGLKVSADNYEERLAETERFRNAQVQSLETIESKTLEFIDERDKNLAILENIEGIKNSKGWLSDILYIIPSMTPITIAIENIDIEKGTVIISGYSADYSSIGSFANKLSEKGSVNIDNITKIAEDEQEREELYTVTMDNPDLISDKYKISHKFTISLDYSGDLMSH